MDELLKAQIRNLLHQLCDCVVASALVATADDKDKALAKAYDTWNNLATNVIKMVEARDGSS